MNFDIKSLGTIPPFLTSLEAEKDALSGAISFREVVLVTELKDITRPEKDEKYWEELQSEEKTDPKKSPKDGSKNKK